MRLFSSNKVIASMLFGASLLVVAACSLDVAMYSTGRLQILVEDVNGDPVPNINADLLLEDKITVWRSTTTGTDGKAEFDAEAGGVAIQGYYVRLILTPDWNMAPGEPNDKAVIPNGGSVIVVRFRIAKVATP
jgi:hypothetical protein